MAGVLKEGGSDNSQDSQSEEPMRRIDMTIYHCAFAIGNKCTFVGDGVPSKQRSIGIGGQTVKFCRQPASFSKDDIVCDKSEVKGEEVRPYVTKSGMLT